MMPNTTEVHLTNLFYFTILFFFSHFLSQYSYA